MNQLQKTELLKDRKDHLNSWKHRLSHMSHHVSNQSKVDKLNNKISNILIVISELS